jgi:hypothetical protein
VYNRETHTFTIPSSGELRSRLKKVADSYQDGDLFLDAIEPLASTSLDPHMFAAAFVNSIGNFVSTTPQILDYFQFLQQSINMIFVGLPAVDADAAGVSKYRAELHAALSGAKSSWVVANRAESLRDAAL